MTVVLPVGWRSAPAPRTVPLSRMARTTPSFLRILGRRVNGSRGHVEENGEESTASRKRERTSQEMGPLL